MNKTVARVVIVAVALALLTGCGSPLGGSPANSGGRRLVLQAACPARNSGCDLYVGVQEAVRVLQGRANTLSGTTEVNTQADAGGRITVTLTGTPDDATARQVLTTEGTLDILDTGATVLPVGTSVAGQTCTTACQSGQYEIVFTGAELDPHSISVQLDQQTGKPVISFAFAGSAKAAFAAYTRQRIGQYLTIAVDRTVVESATIQSEIDGNCEITGLASTDQARDLAAYMQYGQLPVTLSIVSDQRV